MFDAHFVASENIGDFLTFWNNTDSNPASFVLPGCFLSMIDPIRVKVAHPINQGENSLIL